MKNPEQIRLDNARKGTENWSLWGPYLAERAWGTVREDYSPNGKVWDYFGHAQAYARAYRWNEDGLAGICDEQQQLCLSVALWNGEDSILKERAFGLTGHQGNRGEDVKEYYFYEDASPSHAYLEYLYKYPQSAFPYEQIVSENAERDRHAPPFNLYDSGAFNEQRYWDIDVKYAKASPEIIHILITAHNRGPEQAEIYLLPQLWFRNTWSWGDEVVCPQIHPLKTAENSGFWTVQADHEQLDTYYLYGEAAAELMFCNNETNTEKLWNEPNDSAYSKDGFHRRIIDTDLTAVNAGKGSKFGACYHRTVAAGGTTQIRLVLSSQSLTNPLQNHKKILKLRKQEADIFYENLLPNASTEDKRIMRKALAGMIWSKQFFHYDVDRWLRGDQESTAKERLQGRNKNWRHFKAHDVISMPDCWEYPWFAAWDLAYHCVPLALVDINFAKQQIELMLKETYLHPNGQIPAYEWTFDDVNPPVHAFGTLKVFRAERLKYGEGDLNFLQRVFHKLLLNYGWWINRKDQDGHNVFEGGFLGLDNISVYDRSEPLPPGYSLKQADATGWMAMFALNMTVMALEIATKDNDYEGIAIQCYQQFIAIAQALADQEESGIALWDEEAGFFKDVIVTPEGEQHRIDVYSMVGLIPLFACEIIDQRLLKNVPRFVELLHANKGGKIHGHHVFADPDWENQNGEHLLALVDHQRLSLILKRVLDENEFMSRYGVRSLSRLHGEHKDLGAIPGVGSAMIEYIPGESNSWMFGGNSNWRGPIWFPINYSLIQALDKYYRYLGDDFTIPVPCQNNQEMNLKQIADLISESLIDLYRQNEQGLTPAMQQEAPFQSDPNWKDLCFFYEYFHGETGQGLGAKHQTGWTGLIANLIMRRHDRHIAPFWDSKTDHNKSKA
jgi:hypothetical protein